MLHTGAVKIRVLWTGAPEKILGPEWYGDLQNYGEGRGSVLGDKRLFQEELKEFPVRE